MSADVAAWHRDIVNRVDAGERFAGLFSTASAQEDSLTALLAGSHGFSAAQTVIGPDANGELHYPALTPDIPAAFWYERAAHDLSGVIPDGHPRLDHLLLELGEDEQRPRPGHHIPPSGVRAALLPGTADVHGRGMFTIPLGPVRSGVFESIEFLIETPGEDIPRLNIRPHFKHRGIAKRFEGRAVEDGVLVAERVEGIASVAHALAFCHAVESIGGVAVPPRARLLRVVYAELERIANHLEVAIGLTEAAGLAVATSRFGWHKEMVMRLVSALCGSRFGRSTVIPGGVSSEPSIALDAAGDALRVLHARIRPDLTLAMKTPSFIDRLRTTGVLTPDTARQWAALGPIGRASGINDDNRWRRPTDAYGELRMPIAPPVLEAGDVMARANVRWDEIDRSVAFALECLQRLGREQDPALAAPLTLPAGRAFGIGWSEAPQGEALYALTLDEGRIVRCFARSASFHNLATFHDVFGGDVFTDFAFIEASFGLGYAGAAM